MEQRSTLVTVIGWIFIVLSGLFLLQCLMFLFTPFDKLLASMPPQPGQPTPDSALMTSIMHAIFAVVFVIFSWVLLSSIGLVRRKNWARISYMVMMVLGIIWNALYILFGVLILTLGSGLQPAPGEPDMRAVGHVMGIFMTVFGLVFVGLFGWIIYVLNTGRIRKEFETPAAAGPG